MVLKARRFAGNPRLAAAANNSPPMRKDEKDHDAVRILQQALIDLGYPMPITTSRGAKPPDGEYGDETEQTVWKFQSDNGLQKDGRAGRETFGRLDAFFDVRFAELLADSGFDASGKNPWQMVPQGRFKEVKLVNSDGQPVDVAGQSLTSDELAVAQAERALLPGRVAILGRGVGQTAVKAGSRSGAGVATLDITVKRKKIIPTAFLFVRDLANHEPNRDKSSVLGLLEGVNAIYRPQANVEFIPFGAPTRLDINANLGDPIVSTGVPGKDPPIQTLVSSAKKALPGAQFYVIFVWRIASKDPKAAGHLIGGITDRKDIATVIPDSVAGNSEHTLAHEAGHTRNLGSLPDFEDAASKDLLMFHLKGGGTKIPREHADKMNP
jgi:hypothetical protein